MLTHAYPKSTKLKDGRTIVLRPLARGDTDQLLAFFRSLPEEERTFLRHDVCDPEVVRSWTEHLDFRHVIPLIALDGEKIVGDGTLHLATHGWMPHVAHVRLVTAGSHRRLGLGTLIARELVALADERRLEKLQVHVIEDNVGAARMLEAVGFKREALLRDMVKDRRGKKRNLVIMVNDVANLSRTMEDWIQDTMIPAYRVPGDGEG